MSDDIYTGTVPGPRESDGYPGRGDLVLDGLTLVLYGIAAWLVVFGNTPLSSAFLIGVLAGLYATKCVQARMLYRHGYDDGSAAVVRTVVYDLAEYADIKVVILPLHGEEKDDE